MYDEAIVRPMREELTRLGIMEAKTAAEVDAVLSDKKGTALVIVNSVCGCAAGNARPAVALALENAVLPEKMMTVFAGNDTEATARARSYLAGYRPSSPAIALLRDGQVVKILERHQIEGRDARELARELASSFDQYCVKAEAR